MTALLLALAAAVPFGPPSPVLRSGGEELVAARGSFCWTSDERALCSDTLPPVTDDALAVVRRGRVRVDMRTQTTVLHVSLRGRDGRLHVRRIGESKRRFVARLPRRFGKRPVLDLFARYPHGDGFFGARLRVE